MRRAFFIVAIAITALGVMGQARPLVTVFDIGAGVRPVSPGRSVYRACRRRVRALL
jgi:hypothetical protein